MKRAVITGPTGAIGQALIQSLLEQDMQILAVCHRGSGRTEKLKCCHDIAVVECDLSELSQLREKVDGTYDLFYHLAWDGTFGNSRNDMGAQIRNIQYTMDAVQAAYALGCSTFVGAGSQAEYGRVSTALSAETPAFPENGYGMAKLCAGQMSRVMCRELGMRHIWPRFLSIYGPGDQPHSMIMSTIYTLLKGKKPLLTKGEQMWDYLYAADAGRALMLLGERGISGRVYCVGSGTARPLAEYIRTLRDAIDPGLPLGFGEKEYAPAQVMYLCADISDLQKDTGFYPSCRFEEGIRKTIAWCREQQ